MVEFPHHVVRGAVEPRHHLFGVVALGRRAFFLGLLVYVKEILEIYVGRLNVGSGKFRLVRRIFLFRLFSLCGTTGIELVEI